MYIYMHTEQRIFGACIAKRALKLIKWLPAGGLHSLHPRSTITLAHSSWAAGWLVGSVGRSVERSMCVCVWRTTCLLCLRVTMTTRRHTFYIATISLFFSSASQFLCGSASTLFCSCSLLFLCRPSTPSGRCLQRKWKGIADNGRRIYFSLSLSWPVRSAKNSARICVLFLWWDFLVRDGLKAGQICAAVFSIDSFGCWRAAFVGAKCFLGRIWNGFHIFWKNCSIYRIYKVKCLLDTIY